MSADENSMLSRIFRGIICVQLIIMILMCGTFFWGAYNNHRITLHSIGNELKTIAKEVTGTNAKVADARIERLENIQKDLFETNTISFFFILFGSVIITIGGYILSTMSRIQKEAETTMLRIQKEAETAQSNFRTCLGGVIGNLRFELQLQNSLGALHGLCENISITKNLGGFREMLTQINYDRSFMSISDIAMSPESITRHRGTVLDIRNKMRSAKKLEDDIRKGLEDIDNFLNENKKSFEARWEKLLKNLEIESIDIRERV